MNRYYNPSAPKYTSQFVEEEYPLDLMLQSGMMKMQQQADFAKNIGEMEGIIAATPNGFRTERMAPAVREKWATALNDWAGNNLDRYDSPQAISELTRLRTEFLNDPDVQLMKTDYQYGNEEYMSMKQKAGSQDINPNINPITGMIQQFNPGDTYQGYNPFVKYQDVPGRVLQEIGLIKPEQRKVSYQQATVDPVTGEKVTQNVTASKNYRDMQMMEGTLQSLAERAISSNEDWAEYYQRDFYNKTGRMPTMQDAYTEFRPFAEKSIIDEAGQDSSYKYHTDGGSGSGGSKSDIGGFEMNLEVSELPALYEKTSARDMRRIKREAEGIFGSGNPQISSYIANALERAKRSNPNATGKELYNTAISEMKERSKNKYSLPIRTFNETEQGLVTNSIIGDAITKGVITANMAGSLVRGTPMWDYDNKQPILDVDEKSGILKENNYIKILGRPEGEGLYRAWAPGAVVAEVTDNGTSRRVMIQIPELAREERTSWALNGAKRDTQSDIGDVFAADFGLDENGQVDASISDRSMEPFEMEQANVEGKTLSSLYFVPFIDNRDGKHKLNVYYENPLRANSQDPDVYNPEKNEFFLKQYITDSDAPTIDSVWKNKVIKDIYTGDINTNPLRMKMDRVMR